MEETKKGPSATMDERPQTERRKDDKIISSYVTNYNHNRERLRKSFARYRIHNMILRAAVLVLVAVVVAETWYIIANRQRSDKAISDTHRAVTQSMVKPDEPEDQTRAPRYELTAAERELVEGVVMAEAGGEDYGGKLLIAKCILNACEIDDLSPAGAVMAFSYAEPVKPSQDAIEAVTDVFDNGVTVTQKPILYFYAPKYTRGGYSEFHESQEYALSRGGHRFFSRKEK